MLKKKHFEKRNEKTWKGYYKCITTLTMRRKLNWGLGAQHKVHRSMRCHLYSKINLLSIVFLKKIKKISDKVYCHTNHIIKSKKSLHNMGKLQSLPFFKVKYQFQYWLNLLPLNPLLGFLILLPVLINDAHDV